MSRWELARGALATYYQDCHETQARSLWFVGESPGDVAVVEEVIVDPVSGLSERELVRVRGRLAEFAGEMFASMRRKDQRACGRCVFVGRWRGG